MKTFYNVSKKRDKNFSHRYFAIKAGFSSPNFLHLVMNGKRNLTEKYIHSFASAMKLERFEKRYFEAMVLENQARERGVKDYYGNLLAILKKGKEFLSEGEFAVISRWQNVMITELITLGKLPMSCQEIKSFLENKVEISDIAFSLKCLMEAGVIAADKNGSYFLVSELRLKFGPVYRRMLRLAQAILCKAVFCETFKHESTIFLSRSQYELLKQRISEFKEEILNWPTLTEDEPQERYNLNIQQTI